MTHALIYTDVVQTLSEGIFYPHFGMYQVIVKSYVPSEHAQGHVTSGLIYGRKRMLHTIVGDFKAPRPFVGISF